MVANFPFQVENIFDLSFLVKQGSASLAVSEETGLPVVQALKQTGMAEGDQEKDDQKSSQVRMFPALVCFAAIVCHQIVDLPYVAVESLRVDPVSA